MELRMTKESLQSIPLEELVALAREEGYEEGGARDRATLTEFILENLKDRAREKEQENSPSIRVEESKYQITDPQSEERVDSEVFPIADRYNQTKIVFMVRDPHWAFAYWDIDNKTYETLPDKEESHQLILRVYETESIRSPSSGKPPFFDIPIQLGDSSWYIYLPNQDCSYSLELGIISDGRYSCLARSNPIRTPREGIAEAQDYALDLHSDFNAFYGSSSSGSIPQRILAAGTE
jgi:hypothetical protein